TPTSVSGTRLSIHRRHSSCCPTNSRSEICRSFIRQCLESQSIIATSARNFFRPACCTSSMKPRKSLLFDRPGYTHSPRMTSSSCPTDRFLCLNVPVKEIPSLPQSYNHHVKKPQVISLVMLLIQLVAAAPARCQSQSWDYKARERSQQAASA